MHAQGLRVETIMPPSIAATYSDQPYSRTPVTIRFQAFTKNPT
jgi:hypothetical protein